MSSSDHRREFEIAAVAIDHLGCNGEVKITEWIRGSKRAWMSDKNTQTMSFANHCGHSDIWWRAFLRKCHVAIGDIGTPVYKHCQEQ